MPVTPEQATDQHLPTLGELGNDLLSVTRLRRWQTLAMPFIKNLNALFV